MSPRRGSSERRPNINDVADHAGVSVATVSRALRGLANVTPQTRARVEAAARELEYHIDRRASRLATGRHESVGIVVPRIDTWYFSTVVAGIEAVLGRDDDLLLVCVDDVAARSQLVAGSAPLRKRVDGLIFVDVLLEPEEAGALDRAGLRVATVGQRIEGFPSVTIDNRAAARTATEHLLADHDEVALLCGAVNTSLPYSVPGDRRSGFLDAVAAAGASVPDDRIVAADIGVDEGRRAMAHLLDGPCPPTAVFAAADELAFGALACARDRGVAVPDELAVVGFDDHPVAAALDLSTVRQDPEHQGMAAAELFVATAADGSPGPPEHVVSATGLVVRASSGTGDGTARTTEPGEENRRDA